MPRRFRRVVNVRLLSGRELELDAARIIQLPRKITIDQRQRHGVLAGFRGDVVQRVALHPIGDGRNNGVVGHGQQINGGLFAGELGDGRKREQHNDAGGRAAVES